MRLRARETIENTQEQAAALAEQLRISPLAAELLCKRGFCDPEQAKGFLCDHALMDPLSFPNMEEAAAIIRAAIKEDKRIVVYGDYDCDGISACAILVDHLLSMQARVTPYIPSRAFEGYGLNLTAMETIARHGDLLITVDCGISSLEEIAYLREHGVDVVLTDHHTPPEVLPNANVILNPKVASPESAHDLCGCGVAFLLACALGADPERYLPIAAIATIGDIVPLMGENRTIVKQGLRLINQNRPVFLSALLEEARLNYEAVTATHIAFMVVPRINAAGRMDDAMLAYRLLMEDRAKEAAELAKKLCAYNAQRQAMEEVILKEAFSQLERSQPRDHRGVYAFGEGWHHGVVGIVASRLAERFGMPAVVGSVDEDGLCTASLRSVGKVNIFRALNTCGDLFERYGGHAQAGGFTLLAERIPEFIQRFEDVLFAEYTREDFVVYQEYDAVIQVGEIGLGLAKDLTLLEPFGCGNPVPVFLVEGVKAENLREFGKTAVHLKMSITKNGDSAGAILFKAEGKEPIFSGKEYRMLGNLEVERFRGNTSANLIIKAAEPMDADLSQSFREHAYDGTKAFLEGTAQGEELEGEEISYDDIAFLLEENPFGTLILAATPMAALDFVSWLKQQPEGALLMPEQRMLALDAGYHSRNTLLVCPKMPVKGLGRFSRLIYLDGVWGMPQVDAEQELYDCGQRIHVRRFAAEMLLTRERLAVLYRDALGLGKNAHHDLNALCRVLARAKGENVITAGFALHQFLSLGFFQVRRTDGGVLLQPIPQREKLDITDTPLYRQLRHLAGR